MFSLATLQRMNNAVESSKARKRARALNAKNKKHPKNAEKTGAELILPPEPENDGASFRQ